MVCLFAVVTGHVASDAVYKTQSRRIRDERPSSIDADYLSSGNDKTTPEAALTIFHRHLPLAVRAFKLMPEFVRRGQDLKATLRTTA